MKKILFITAFLFSFFSYSQIWLGNTDRQKIDSLSYANDTLNIKIENDELKKVRIVSGGGDFKADGSVPATGNFNMSNNNIDSINVLQFVPDTGTGTGNMYMSSMNRWYLTRAGSAIGGIFDLTDLTVARIYNLPNSSGTLALTSDIPSLSTYLQSGDNVSELVNDAGYITDADVGGIVASGTVSSQSTPITVNHGLGYSPDASRIMITPLSTLAVAVDFYVTNITSTTFDVINMSNPSGSVFSWAIFGSDNATPMTGSEIVSSIDTELGSTDWQGGGGGTDDQTASEVPFTPYLTISSTDVQTAIEELKDEVDNSSGGYAVPVTDITSLQGLSSGDVGAITSTVDLGNTDVTIPSGVTLISGNVFGSLISTGTGEINMAKGSYIDPLLLNYRLNIDPTSEGTLTHSDVVFNAGAWGITETADMTGSIVWSNTTARDEAINNGLRLEKAMFDVVKLGGTSLSVPAIDFYIGLGHYDDVIEDTVSDTNYRDGVVDVPSGIHLKMSPDTYLRKYPNYNYGGGLLEIYDQDNVKISGGNLIGERDTHLYRNILIVTAAATSSPFTVTIRDDSGVGGSSVNSDITINSPGTATRQSTAEDIRDGILALHPTWTVTASQYEGGSNWAVYTDNNTPGRGLEVEPASTNASGGSFAFGNNRHELCHGIYIIGSKGVEIDGVNISNPTGDNIAIVGKNPGGLMTFANNSENIQVKNCFLDYGRRLGLAANSVENLHALNNVITNAGRPYNSNRGTEPASGIWFEPFRTRSSDGTLNEYSIARNIVVEGNRVFDSESASIGLYTTYDATVLNNYVNNTVSFDFGEQNRVVYNTIDLSAGSYPSSVGIDFDVRDDGGFPFTREIPTHNLIHGNTIKGDTTLVAQNQVGISIQGYKTIVSENIIRNMGEAGISIGTATDMSFINNYIINDPELTGTTERGYVMTSSNTQNTIIEGGQILVGGSPFRFTSNNDVILTGNGQRYNKTYVKNIPVVESTGDIIESGSVPMSYMQGPNNVEFDNVHFYDRIYFNGGGNDSLVIKNSTFEKDIYFNGSGQDQIFVDIHNNVFEDDGTTASQINMETRDVSNNINIWGNVFKKASGAEAIRIIENGGQNNGFRIFNNHGIGNMTELLDFTGSGSFIWGNTKNGATSQTITLGSEGTANSVN